MVTESAPVPPSIVYPPAGAPNVVVVLLDDVGFGAASTFGGPSPHRRWTASRGRACATTSSTRPRCAHPRVPRC